MIPVRSSSVAAVGYDDQTNELTIRFIGGGTYVYAMVPRSVVDGLLAAESIGTYVNATVKPTYPVREG